MAVQTKRSEICKKTTRANIPLHGPEQVRLESCCLYDIVSLSHRTFLRLVEVRLLRLPLASFERLPLTCNEGVVSKETVVLRRWGSSIQKFGFINGVDNINWPPYRDSKS